MTREIIDSFLINQKSLLTGYVGLRVISQDIEQDRRESKCNIWQMNKQLASSSTQMNQANALSNQTQNTPPPLFECN